MMSVLAVTNVAAQEVYVDSLFAVQRDSVVYGTAPINIPPFAMDLVLDVYRPVGEGIPDPRPGLICIHGGGFSNPDYNRNDPHWVRFASAMAGRGYTAASIDYRIHGDSPVISPEFQQFRNGLESHFPGYTYNTAICAAVEDATCALRWMVEKSDSLHVNAGSLALAGSSAGAMTSLFIAYVIDDYGVTNVPEVGVLLGRSWT